MEMEKSDLSYVIKYKNKKYRDTEASLLRINNFAKLS